MDVFLQGVSPVSSVTKSTPGGIRVYKIPASSLPQTVKDKGRVSEACMRWKMHGSLHTYEDNSPGFNLQLGFNRLSKEEVCGCHGNTKLPRTRLVSKGGWGMQS